MGTEQSVCEIYEHRPQFCRDYPHGTSPMPDSCGYHFKDGQRLGRCNRCGSCCRAPREGGEPDGVCLPRGSGAPPCKHLQIQKGAPDPPVNAGEVGKYPRCVLSRPILFVAK